MNIFANTKKHCLTGEAHPGFACFIWKSEQEEWLEAIEEVLENQGKGRTEELFQRLRYLIARKGVGNGGHIAR